MSLNCKPHHHETSDEAARQPHTSSSPSPGMSGGTARAPASQLPSLAACAQERRTVGVVADVLHVEGGRGEEGWVQHVADVDLQAALEHGEHGRVGGVEHLGRRLEAARARERIKERGGGGTAPPQAQITQVLQTRGTRVRRRALPARALALSYHRFVGVLGEELAEDDLGASLQRPLVGVRALRAVRRALVEATRRACSLGSAAAAGSGAP